MCWERNLQTLEKRGDCNMIYFLDPLVCVPEFQIIPEYINVCYSLHQSWLRSWKARRRRKSTLITCLDYCASYGTSMHTSKLNWVKNYERKIWEPLTYCRWLFDFSFCSPENAAKVDLVSMFSDLFGCAYQFAKSQGWNSEPLLKEMFRTKEFPRDHSTARAERTATNSDEHLGLSDQGSQQVSPDETKRPQATFLEFDIL